MADFNLAIPLILKLEGGFVDNKNDIGGATNFGVSLRWLKAQGLLENLELQDRTQDEVQVVKDLTADDAKALYKTYFWNPNNYDSINSQMIAEKIFNMTVNMGARRSHLIVQNCLGFTSEQRDGLMGAKTIAEVNAAASAPFVVALQNMQAAFYRQLVAVNPKLQPFLQGWLNRSYDRNS
jgi:lysozyme family protein